MTELAPNPYLLSRVLYRVKVPLVTARFLSGRRQNFTAGAVLPREIDPRHVEHMLSHDLIEEVVR